MTFEEALNNNRLPARIGDVSIRYEDSLLIGQSPRPFFPAAAQAAAMILAWVCAGLAIAALLQGNAGPGIWGILVLVTGCALGLFWSSRLSAARRRPRTFVLNFGDETLRLEVPGEGWSPSPASIVSFDDVRDLTISENPDRTLRLIVEVIRPTGDRPISSILIDRVPRAEVESLRRIWKFLRSCFGLINP